MSRRTLKLLFFLLAPITVPGYLVFLAISNLIGAAFYIVVEASLSRMLRRPISFSPLATALLAVPVLIVAPIAALGHLLIGFFRGLGRILSAVGHWQTGITSRPVSFAVGLVWAIVATWGTLICLNAAMGMALIGRGIPKETINRFVEVMRRRELMADLPADMQERRRQILKDLAAHRGRLSPDWDIIQDELGDDHFPFSQLSSQLVMRKVGGLPWYYIPKEFSTDGLDHSTLLLGPLLFCWLLLIRWPGMMRVLRFGVLKVGWYLIRVAVVLGVAYFLGTWVPLTVDDRLWLNVDAPSRLMLWLSPAAWLGESYQRFAQPEWYLLNAAYWFILIGLVAFIWWTAWRVSPFLGWPRYYVAFLASRLLQRKRIAFFSVGAVTLCVAMMIIVISVMGGFVDSIRNRADSLLGDLVIDAGTLQGFPFYEEFITDVKKLKDEATGEPLVEEATPLIHSYGILQVPEMAVTKAVRIWGVRLSEFVRVNDFGKDLFYHARYGGTRLDVPMGQPVWGIDDAHRVALPGDMDRWYRDVWLASLSPAAREEALRLHPRDAGRFMGPGVFAPTSSESDFKPRFEGEEYTGIILGRDVLFERRASGEYSRPFSCPRGALCLLTVLPMSQSGEILRQAPPKPAFRYVDDSKTGIHEIDSMNVYIDFARLQDLLDMEPQELETGGMTSARCSQIQVKLKPRFAWPLDVLEKQKKRVWASWKETAARTPATGHEASMLRNVGIQTWLEMQAGFISAIEKEKFLVLIMFGVISIVAVLLILCIFYMIVQEKTRDIGIIKSVGASTEGVVAVFLVYGAAIGIVGSILGSLLGTTFVEHINDVQDWLARINPAWRVWSPDTYSFEKIPNEWKWDELLKICGAAILSSIFGAALPALRAGRTWPVEALRYE